MQLVGGVRQSLRVPERRPGYGENVKSEGTQTIPYPFGFKGGYRMPGGNKGLGNVTNGLLHFGARYYDPTIGRWTQPDPLNQISSPAQADRFLFAGSDPLNSSDPSGLSEANDSMRMREAARVLSPLAVVSQG